MERMMYVTGRRRLNCYLRAGTSRMKSDTRRVSMILQAIMLVLILGAVPFATGLLLNGNMRSENRSIGITYVGGFMILLGTFQLITVPIVFADAWGFDWVIKIYTIIITIFAGMGIIKTLHMWRKGEEIFRKREAFLERTKSQRMQWAIVLLLILFHP